MILPVLGQRRSAGQAPADDFMGPPAPRTSRPPRREQKPPEVQEAETKVFQEIRKLNEDTKKLGPWKKQSDLIINSTNRIFERNGWDNATDQFARQISTEVTKIPPWDATGRFNKLVELMARRYQMDESQKQQLRAMLAWESFNFFMKHSPDLLEQSREMVSTRSRGKAFTPEQVAKWSKVGKPLMREWQERLSNISERMQTRLRPNQLAAINRDLRSWDRRTHEIAQMMDRWERGEWDPADWGLDTDPMHKQPQLTAGDRRERPAPEPAQDPGPPEEGQGRPAPRDPLFEVAGNLDEWERYVRQFITRYKLDTTQETSALSILDQLYDRALQMRETRADQLAQIDRRIRSADDPETKKRYTKEKEDVLAPIRSLFDDLKRRLDGLPTEAQRQAAGGNAKRKAK